MRVFQVWLGYESQQPVFDLSDIFSRRDARAIGDSENMRVHRHGGLTKCRIEYDVSGLAANAWQGL